MNLRTSDALVHCASMPAAFSFWRTSASAAMARIAPFKRSTIAGGVPAGTSSAFQPNSS